MGRQWELQLLLPFSFYIDAKVLLFFELAKFNFECEPHGQKCGTSGSASRTGDCGTSGRAGRIERARRVGRQVGQVRQVRQVGRVGELFGYSSLIVRSLFAYSSLIVRSSYIVLFVFLIFISSKFFILLSDFNCISVC